METISYYLSQGLYGDGKSVCLWRRQKVVHQKIARFQSDEAARRFAEDFGFPLSDDLKYRLYND